MATGYHTRGCRPEGALWLVVWKGERTESDQQTGGFASVRQEREDPRGVDSRSRGTRGRGPRRGGLPQPRGRGERTQEGCIFGSICKYYWYAWQQNITVLLTLTAHVLRDNLYPI